MEGNSTEDTNQFDEDIRNLRANLSKTTNELENLIRLHAASGGISDSEVLGKMVREREDDRASIKAKISSLERQRERIDGGKVDRKTMESVLSDYLSLYDTFDKDHKRQLNQILFCRYHLLL